MPAHHGTESEFEATTIERLKLLGYEHTHGTDLVRPLDEVVLLDVLRESLAERYSDLPQAALDEAVKVFSRPAGADHQTAVCRSPSGNHARRLAHPRGRG